MDMQSWFEKGDLPPVGVECEWLSYNTGVWHQTKVKAYDNDGQAWLEGEGIVSVLDFGINRFRPIKSEREKFIEVASKVLHQTEDGVINDISLGQLFDVGFRAPQSSQLRQQVRSDE